MCAVYLFDWGLLCMYMSSLVNDCCFFNYRCSSFAVFCCCVVSSDSQCGLYWLDGTSLLTW